MTAKLLQLAFLWVLNYSDGIHSLTDICMLSGLELNIICEAADMLKEKGLIENHPAFCHKWHSAGAANHKINKSSNQ